MFARWVIAGIGAGCLPTARSLGAIRARSGREGGVNARHAMLRFGASGPVDELRNVTALVAKGSAQH